MVQFRPLLREHFWELYEDGSGRLATEELPNADENLRTEMKKVLNLDDGMGIFDAWGNDDSGSIEIHEFIAGIIKIDYPERLIEPI